MAMTTIEVHHSDRSPATGQAPAGWHADPDDRTLTRYWNGTAWAATRRWNGSEWVDAPSAPPVVPVPATAGVSRTFKVFAGSAVAAVLGYFLPVTIVTGEFGGQDSHNLGEL